MADELNPLDVFVKIDGDSIVEYPVYRLHITNRAHPLDWYTRVVYETKPEVPDFHYAKEELSLKNKVPTISYVVTPLSLTDLLNNINARIINDPEASQDPNARINFSELDPNVVKRIAELATQRAQSKLDAFAMTKNYDNAVFAISYKDSSIPTFSADAAKIISIRDQLWPAMYKYIDDVMQSIKPVPRTVDEIDAIMPAFKWE
jgi:hypothetical protein